MIRRGCDINNMVSVTSGPYGARLRQLRLPAVDVEESNFSGAIFLQYCQQFGNSRFVTSGDYEAAHHQSRCWREGSHGGGADSGSLLTNATFAKLVCSSIKALLLTQPDRSPTSTQRTDTFSNLVEFMVFHRHRASCMETSPSPSVGFILRAFWRSAAAAA